jgi:hypothetical protein
MVVLIVAACFVSPVSRASPTNTAVTPTLFSQLENNYARVQPPAPVPPSPQKCFSGDLFPKPAAPILKSTATPTPLFVTQNSLLASFAQPTAASAIPITLIPHDAFAPGSLVGENLLNRSSDLFIEPRAHHDNSLPLNSAVPSTQPPDYSRLAAIVVVRPAQPTGTYFTATSYKVSSTGFALPVTSQSMDLHGNVYPGPDSHFIDNQAIRWSRVPVNSVELSVTVPLNQSAAASH